MYNFFFFFFFFFFDGGVPLQPRKTLIISFGERYPFLGIFLETLTHFKNGSSVMKMDYDDWDFSVEKVTNVQVLIS